MYITLKTFLILVCSSDEYDCEDFSCIASELRCNGVNNCRFRWDEDGCPVCLQSNC